MQIKIQSEGEEYELHVKQGQLEKDNTSSMLVHLRASGQSAPLVSSEAQLLDFYKKAIKRNRVRWNEVKECLKKVLSYMERQEFPPSGPIELLPGQVDPHGRMPGPGPI